MTPSMIGMLFHGWDWPLLPQFLAFAPGAWWFTVQASSTRAQSAIRALATLRRPALRAEINGGP